MFFCFIRQDLNVCCSLISTSFLLHYAMIAFDEAVDIGEVDLIVNFDCLSSPIRMIQRVGRTGRKRDGRVVTLVAEGSEEKTYVPFTTQFASGASLLTPLPVLQNLVRTNETWSMRSKILNPLQWCRTPPCFRQSLLFEKVT